MHITYSTDDGLIEVAAAGVNKGSALAALADRWGIDAKDVIAFGDMPNDLEMLRWAGFGRRHGQWPRRRRRHRQRDRRAPSRGRRGAGSRALVLTGEPDIMSAKVQRCQVTSQ